MAGFLPPEPGYGRKEIEAAIEAFHGSRQARAEYEVLPLEKSPLPVSQAESGAVAVAATLGERVGELSGLPALEPCLKAALAQLQDYLNYRIMKLLAPKKLHLGWPVVPGGAAATTLTYEEVLDLLPDSHSGVRAEDGRLAPAWSLVFLYPIGPKPDKFSACASCSKDCALRK